MWKEICRFEIDYHLRQPLFYCAALFFFASGVLLISTEAGAVLSHVTAMVARDAPYIVVRMLAMQSILSLFVVTGFVASSALRDFDLGTHMLFFSRPVKKHEYLLGRFSGSIAISMGLFFIAALGLVAGRFAPWQDPTRLGPFQLEPYLFGLGVYVLPNLFIFGAIFFALAIWTRRLLVTYIGVVFVLVLQDVVEEAARNLENVVLGSVIEPMGLIAQESAARYWSAIEYGSRLPELDAPLIYNRLAWIILALVMLAIGHWRFDYARASSGGKAKKVLAKLAGARLQAEGGSLESAAPLAGSTPPEPARAERLLAEPPRNAIQETITSAPIVKPRFSLAGAWSQWLHQTRMDTRSVLQGTPFLVLLALVVVFTVSLALVVGQNRGTPVYPLTHLMLTAIQINLQMFLTIILIFYSGELVWRERSLGISGVLDATPTPNWVFVSAKLATLVLVIVVVQAIGVATTVGVQLSKGFARLEPELYLQGSFASISSFVVLAALTLFLQVISPTKFTGFLMMIVVLMVRRFLPVLGVEHRLLRFGDRPPLIYSDMNGFGHHVEPVIWYGLYWSLAAAILVILAVVMWPRGRPSGFGTELVHRARSFRGPLAWATLVLLMAQIGSAGWIVYNTNVLNPFLSRRARADQLAHYEREYSRYAQLPLPRISAVSSEVDIFPKERRVEIRGRYTLVNDGDAPIRQLPITVGARVDHDYLPFSGLVRLDGVELAEHQVVVEDRSAGFYIFKLKSPLASQDSLELGFQVSASSPGFRNHRADHRLVANGTFFANKNFFPLLGYVKTNELQNPILRRKRGLAPMQGMAAADDPAGLRRSYLGADWIRFESTVSTSEDQIAIASGVLKQEWVESGRRYARYASDIPIIDLICFASAEYAVARDRWNDVDILIYHHPEHDFNIERMLESSKRSLEYFSENFGPYHLPEIRIVEVPSYIGITALSMAGMMPFSETAGFISEAPQRDIDMLSDFVAHEVSHQWWNHQTIGGDVQGSTMIAETLAQYSALMVMEHLVGPDHIRPFLRHELDFYLAQRSRETAREMPLLLVENQPYVHYNKGSLIMYALKDYIGEEELNGALRRFLEATSFTGPPYTNCLELMEHIRQVVPPRYEYLIEDMFETITFYDNAVVGSQVEAMPDGGYRLALETNSRKLRADGRGDETEIPVDDWIDIGVFGTEERDGRRHEVLIYLEKHRITSGTSTIQLELEQRPVRAGIDPLSKLIDRNPDDNTRSVRP